MGYSFTMHIVFLADPIDNQRAGVHFYTKNLIEALLRVDQENTYTFIHRKENPFFNDKNNLIIPKKLRHLDEYYRKLHLIPKAIKKLQPDIVFEPSHIGPFGIPKTIKRAVLIHDLTPILFPQFHPGHSSRIHRIIMPRILKNADLILTPSQTTKQDIQKKYKTNATITPIYAGADTKQQQQFNRPIPEPYLLYLGTIEPRKNIPTLIDAFLELKKEASIPHKLILAGGIGWKTNDILQKAANTNIIVTDYLKEDQKQSYLQHADIFIYPSFYEGFGMPPLEAMHHGIPVITSTGGSLKEIYQNHTLQFEPEDKNTLKKHILDLLNNKTLRNQIIQKGHQLTQQFTWDNTARKVVEAFKKTMQA